MTADGGDDALRRPGPTLPRGWRALVLVLAALLFLALGASEARQDSLTVDEGPDLAAGVSGWVHRDLRVNPEHGVIPHLLAGLPALAAHPEVPQGESWRSGDWFDYTDEFVAANAEADRLEDALFLARLAGLALTLAAAVVIHVLAARWFGRDAALVAALAWLTSPLVLGIGHTALIEPASTLAILLLVLAAARLVEAPSDGRAVAAGLALGALLLCRHSGLPLALLPVGAAVVAAGGRRQAIRWVAVIGLVALVSMWGVYRGVDPSGPDGRVEARFEGLVDAAGSDSLAARVVGATPLPLEWRAGFGHLTLTSEAKTASLLGQTWEGGRPWYYPVSLLIASPPLTALLLVLGPLGLRAAPRARRRVAVALAGGAGGLVLALLVLQPLQLGPRLALPVLATGLVLGSSAVPALDDRRWIRPVGAVLLVVQVALLVTAHPGTIGWTPPPLRPAHRWAGAAAVDLGQDLRRLEEWVADHGPDPVAVAVVSSRGYPEIPGTTDLRDLPPEDVRGWVAVSASALITFGDDLSWLRAHCPVDGVGRGILVYRFAEAPDVRPGPALPEGRCAPGRPSSRTAD